MVGKTGHPSGAGLSAARFTWIYPEFRNAGLNEEQRGLLAGRLLSGIELNASCIICGLVAGNRNAGCSGRLCTAGRTVAGVSRDRLGRVATVVVRRSSCRTGLSFLRWPIVMSVWPASLAPPGYLPLYHLFPWIGRARKSCWHAGPHPDSGVGRWEGAGFLPGW